MNVWRVHIDLLYLKRSWRSKCNRIHCREKNSCILKTEYSFWSFQLYSHPWNSPIFRFLNSFKEDKKAHLFFLVLGKIVLDGGKPLDDESAVCILPGRGHGLADCQHRGTRGGILRWHCCTVPVLRVDQQEVPKTPNPPKPPTSPTSSN